MASDDEEFGCLLGGDERTGGYEDTTEFTYSKQQLADANILPKKLTDWMKENKHLSLSDITKVAATHHQVMSLLFQNPNKAAQNGLYFLLNITFPSASLFSNTANQLLPGQSGTIRTPSAFSLSAFRTTLQTNPTGG